MKKFYKLHLLIIVLLFSISSCEMDSALEKAARNENLIASPVSNVIVGPSGNVLNPSEFATILENKLKSSTIGFAFTVSHNGALKTIRSGGESRRPQDPTTRIMSVFDRYSCASVSKTISATALLKLLYNDPNVSLNSPMWTYLPKHWTFGPNIKSITFRELLTHNSGFRYGLGGIGDGDDYKTLKALIAKGIIVADKSTSSYNNRNYGLLRLLIPRLAGYNISQIDSSFPSFLVEAFEAGQAKNFADAYIDYCRKNIFDKLGSVPNAECNNTDPEPPLTYVFPKTFEKGKIAGDLTLVAGGQGWVLTTLQMSHFFRALHYTQDIIPKILSDKMKNEKLGYDVIGQTNDGVNYFWKNGIYNWGNHGYRSLIIGFGNDVQVAIMTNSKINLQDTVIAAFQEWYK